MGHSILDLDIVAAARRSASPRLSHEEVASHWRVTFVAGGKDMGQKTGAAGFVLATLEQAVNWGREYSLWPLTFGLACCAIEALATGASHYDLSRFGMEFARPSPRQADLMIVAGRVSRKIAPVVRRLYDQMGEPKWVIAMGDCASCGGVFNNYAIVQGVDEIVPVDVYIAGCPPRPEALLNGILHLHGKIRTESFEKYAFA